MDSHSILAFLEGRSGSTRARLLRGLLIPFALVVGSVAALRRALHGAGLLRTRRITLPVLSVGNPGVGGTGKTPFVRFVCRRLRDQGWEPLVVSRGYGAPVGEMDEEGASLAREGFRVAQGRDRARVVAEYLRSERGVDIVVLDDGAQALELARDMEIMLVDAERPLGSGWPLPAGSLREFAGVLRRAQAIVVTRSERVPAAKLEQTLAKLRSRFDPELLGTARHVPECVLPGEEPPESLKGRRAHLFSGIARPLSFEATARDLGIHVTGTTRFGDHHAFTAADLETLGSRARGEGADLLLCTGKDGPKVFALGVAEVPVMALEVRMALDEDTESWLDEALQGLRRTS